jgi:hypothetical protein
MSHTSTQHTAGIVKYMTVSTTAGKPASANIPVGVESGPIPD